VTFLLRAAAVLAVILGLPVAGLFLSGFGLAGTGAIIQLAMWLILVSAYCSFWFALAFAVNAFGGTSESNALVLAGCWIVLVILIPASLNLTLKQIYPLPSRVAFLNAVRGASADAERMGSKLLENYLQDHSDLAPGDKKENANDYIETLIAVNAETDRAVDPLKKLFQEQQDRQLALIEKLSLVSPAIVLQQAANLLSGNDQARRLKFMAAVETHRKEVRRFLDPAFVTEAPFTGYDSIPPFKYNDSFFGVKVSRLAGDIATLAGFSLMLAAWGWRALGRPILES
jgi:ABC-2 type transport system permease protein